MALTRVLLAIALIVVAGAGGFVAYRLTGTHTASLSVAPIVASPAETPQRSESRPERQIPEVIPELTLTDGAGVRHKLTEWKGRPALFNFWATWCEPCRREIPLLQALRHEHSADGVEVIGIAVDFRDAVLKYAQAMHIDYPLLIGEQDALDAVGAFGMESVFPFTVFADSRARIVTLKVGELHADEADFILSRVRDLDAGRLELRAAREQIAAGIRQLAAQRAAADATPSGETHYQPDPRISNQEVP